MSFSNFLLPKFNIHSFLSYPVFNQFQPELVLVSAGYDAALGCPEVRYQLIDLGFFLFQFNPQLVLISAGFDSALGDEKVENILNIIK